MNNNNLEKFIEEMKSIKMTSLEKNEMRKNLSLFASTYAPVISPYHSMSLMLRRSAAFAFIAILSIGSLSNIASTNALPGDTFYPVKIAHEEIKLAATVDTKRKISYEIKRTEKRIQEATSLADKNELDSGKQITIAQEIKKQTTKVRDYIDEVKTSDPEEALVLNSEFKSTVKVNKEALRQVTASSDKKKKDIKEKEDKITLEELDEINEGQGTNSDAADLPETVLDIPEIIQEVNISSAEQLLDSIEEEVEDIEAFQEVVTQEIIDSEEEEISPENITESEITVDESLEQEEIIDSEEEEIFPENITESEITVDEHIKSLNDLLDIKKSIKEIKGDSVENLVITEDTLIIFNEEDMREKANNFITEKKYKKAFIALQTILEKYKEENITKSVEYDLGIDLHTEIDSIDVADIKEDLSEQESLLLISNEAIEKIENLELPKIIE